VVNEAKQIPEKEKCLSDRGTEEVWI
jgi:hypothetical protein